MNLANPLNVRIAADSNYQLSAVAHGKSAQRITISHKGKPVATFSGSGDGSQMKELDGTTTCAGATRPATEFTILFQHSNTGPDGPFQNSAITVDSTAGIVTTIVSGDSGAKEANGAVLTLVVNTLVAVGAGR